MAAPLVHHPTAPITLLLVAFMLSSAVPTMAGEKPLRDTVADLEPAVVSVLAIRADGSANQGSGFIVREDGLVVTSYHVVKNALTLEVAWSNRLDRGLEFAKLVRSDPDTDLALLQLPGYNYPTLPLADPDDIRVGDDTAVLGYPVGDVLGLGDLSVTRGIVSALRRDAGGAVELVQTDARIAVGNSGGPLIDLDANGVVGVVRAKGVAELEGINFAMALEPLARAFPEVHEDVDGRLTSPRLFQPASQPTDLIPGSHPSAYRGPQSVKLDVLFDDAAQQLPADHPLLNRVTPPSADELTALTTKYPGLAQGHYLLGVAAYVACDWESARHEFEQAYALYPADMESARYLALLAEAAGDPLAAEHWSTRAESLGCPSTR